MSISHPFGVLFVMLLVAVPAGAQGISTSLTDGPVQEFVRFDGVTLVHETRGFDGFRQVETVAIADLDMSGARMVSNGTVAAISLRCRATSGSCIRTSASVRVAGSVQTVNDTAAESSLRCRPADCAQLFTAIRGGSAAGVPAGRQTPINCEALRSTYAAGGQQIALPPECTTELDRLSTYQPGKAAQPPTAPPRETVIDGSKIPSHIDFSRPAPAPTSPSPTPNVPGSPPTPAVSSPASPVTPSPPPVVGNPPTPSPATLPEPDAAYAPIPLTFFDVFKNFERWARETASAAMQAARDLVNEYSEGFATFLFDEWSGDDFDAGPTALLKGYLHEQVKDQASRLLESEASRSLLGRPMSELPIEFQRDKAVWDAAARHAFEGKTLTGGFDEVKAIGELIPVPVKR